MNTTLAPRRMRLRALMAVALGHAVAVTAALALMALAAIVVPVRTLQVGGAGALFCLAAYLSLRPREHPGRPGMRMRFTELVLWSCLMSSAHGAGLMLFPVLVRGAISSQHAAHGHAAHLLSRRV